MSVIIRLQGLSWSASAMDIRNFFKGLNIPPGGVHIIGGERGDAFIAFSTDEDARRAMLLNNGKLNDMPVMLFLSSKTEMQNTIIEAKERSTAVSAPLPSTQQPISSAIAPPTAINPTNHQLPVIPGLGMQPHLPQINQLSQFLSGLLPNADLTSSVVSKLINQQQQQHMGQLKLPSTSSPVGSSFKALNEHALPGEYSVGGIPQGSMPTHNYMNQQVQHGHRDMPPFGMNRGNVQPLVSVAYSQSTQGMPSVVFTAHSQSGMNDPTQLRYSNRSESERRPEERTNQENLVRPDFYEGRNQQMPRSSGWTDKERRADHAWSAQSGGRDDNGSLNFNKQNNDRNRTAGIPLTSAPVSTSALNTKPLNSLPIASSETTVKKNEKDARPQTVSNKKPQAVESKLPITIMADDETELDEFGRTVRKRPTTDSPTSKRESGDSRERSRDRDRSRRHDSPRRDRRDRDRRDRDRRDRDRDRRNRDRDDDKRDRYREQDRRNSPATSDSYRRSKKRSLSPSNTNEKEADKKLQTDKQGNTKPSMKTETPSTNTNDVKIGLHDNLKKEPLGGIDNQPIAKSSGPTPIFPVIPPLGSGMGILGAAPPICLNQGIGEKTSILPEPNSTHLNRPLVAHKEDFNGNEPSNRKDGPLISEIDRNDVFQRPKFPQESRGSQDFPRYPVAERNVPMDFRGHSADRTDHMLVNNLQQDTGPPGFMRGPPNRGPLNEENRGRLDFNRGPSNRVGPPNREGMHGPPGNNDGPIEMEPFSDEARGHPDFHQGPPNREPLLGGPGCHPDINRGIPNRKPDNNSRHPDFIQGPPNRGGFPEESVRPFVFNQEPQNKELLFEDSRRNPDIFRGPPIGQDAIDEDRDQIDYNRGPLFDENRGHPDLNQRRPDRENMMEDRRGTQDYSRARPHRGPLLEETDDRPDFHQGHPTRRGLLEENRGPPDITRGPTRGALLGDPPGFRNRMGDNGSNAFIDGRRRGAPSLLGDGPRDLRDLPPPGNRGPWERDNEEMDQQMDFLPHLQEDSVAINGPPNDFRGPTEFGVREGDFEYQHERSDLRNDRFDGRPPIERGGIERGAPNDRPFRGGRPPFDSIRPTIEPRPMQFNPDGPGPMAGRQNLNDLSEENPDMPMPGNRPDRYPGEFVGRARFDQPAPRRRTLLKDPVSQEMSPEFMGMPPRNTPDFPNRTGGHRPEFQRFPPGQDGFPPQNRHQENRVGPLHGNNDMNEREFRQNSGNRREHGRRDDRGFPRPPFSDSSERRDRQGTAGAQSDNTRVKPPQEQPRSREPSRTRDRASDRDPRERGSRNDARCDEESRKQTTAETSGRDKSATDVKKSERQEPKPKKDTTVKGDFFVSMSNIPLEFSHGDIAKLYSGCAIARKGIKVINDSTGKRTGKAYVQFCNADSHAAALKLSGSVLGKRIIAVNEVPKKEFIDAVDSYEPDSDEDETDRERSKKIDLCNTLTATLMNLKGENMTFPVQNKGKNNASATKGKEESKPDQQKNNNNQTSAYFVMVGQLPEKTSVTDIRNLFRNCAIAENSDAIKMGEVVNGSRQCFVEFADEKSLKSALQTKRVFRGSTIIIKQSTKTEFDQFMNQTGRDSAPHEKGGKDVISDKRGDSAAGDKTKQSVNKDCTCVRVTNLPYDFHHHDFRRLFDGLGVAPRGIQVCHDALGRTLGEGCVELMTHIEAQKAHQKDGLVIGRNKIRVELITKQTLIDHMRHAKQALRPELATQTQVFFFVKAENLPANVSTGEIINFFNGYRPSPESIRLNVGDKTDDPNCSTALVGFRQKEDAERAVHKLNKYPLRNRTIALEKVIL